MASLKELLGESYKEGMTFEEVDSVLSGKKLVDLASGEYVSKGKLLDAEKKAKDFEKKLTDRLTEEEKAEVERQKQTEYYQGVEKQLKVMQTKEKLSKSIKDKDVLTEVAELYANGDISQAIDKQNEYFENEMAKQQQKQQDDNMRNNPNPAPQGDPKQDKDPFELGFDED